MTVSFGNTALHFILLPFKFRHAFIPATSPEAIDSTYPSTPVICPAKYILEFFFKLYVLSKSSGEFINVFLCITPYLINSAFSNPGIKLNTLFCSPNFKFVWKPTILNKFPSVLSCLNCTIAYGLFPVLKSVNPTGFNGPNLSVSIPLFAITSTGIHPSNISFFSKL